MTIAVHQRLKSWTILRDKKMLKNLSRRVSLTKCRMIGMCFQNRMNHSLKSLKLAQFELMAFWERNLKQIFEQVCEMGRIEKWMNLQMLKTKPEFCTSKEKWLKWYLNLKSPLSRNHPAKERLPLSCDTYENRTPWSLTWKTKAKADPTCSFAEGCYSKDCRGLRSGMCGSRRDEEQTWVA